MALGITGDAQDRLMEASQPLSLPLPIVPQADLEDATHPINEQKYSGKQRYAMCLVEATGTGTLQMAVAKGSKPTDVWMDAVGATLITPA